MTPHERAEILSRITVRVDKLMDANVTELTMPDELDLQYEEPVTAQPNERGQYNE